MVWPSGWRSRAIERSGEVVFRCTVSGSDVDRWLEIPAWMFERSAWATVRVAADAHVDLSALMALAELVRDALSDRFAPSNALLSGASSLFRDQNRGEVHATPGEADEALRRLPQQIDLFAGEPKSLPTETQAALTDLMTRLILDHADSMMEADYDL
jgi:hypothetical protein